MTIAYNLYNGSTSMEKLVTTKPRIRLPDPALRGRYLEEGVVCGAFRRDSALRLWECEPIAPVFAGSERTGARHCPYGESVPLRVTKYLSLKALVLSLLRDFNHCYSIATFLWRCGVKGFH